MRTLDRIKAKAKEAKEKWNIRRARSPVPVSNDTPSEAPVPMAAHDLDHSSGKSGKSVQALASSATDDDGGWVQQTAVPRIEEETHPSPGPPLGSQPEATNEEVNTETVQLDARNDLWGQAFNELSEQQQTQLLALVKGGNPDSQAAQVTASIIPDLIALTKQRQEECEQKFWRVRLGKGPGDEIILREQAAQIISWLTLAGDIGVQFSPTLVSQVWPVIKALLKLPVQEAEQMAAVLKVADKVSRLVARGRVFEACYSTTNTRAEALQNLHAALVAVYKACLAILATASGLLQNNLFERTVHSILHPDAVTNEVGVSLPELETQLAYDVQAAESARTAEITDKLVSWLRKLDTPIARMDERVAKVLEAVDAREEQEILEWISPLLYSSYHDFIAERRMPDTCDWILRHPRFQEWERSSGCALMWLWGLSGTGKTFLTSKVVDYKIGLLDSSPNDEAVAFFYFNRSDSTRNTALACLRSLVRQFSTCRSRQGHIRSSLRKTYMDCRRDGRTMSWELCKKQLTESLDLFPRSTIIVDALDECDEDYRQDLVRILTEMMEISRRPLMILISGRPDGDIRDAFRDRVKLEIGVEDNQEDIAKFVEEKVKGHHRWDRFTKDTKERVVTTLIEQSQAMFRWAALQIHELLKLRLEEDVNTRLGKLPKDLKTTYDDIYSRQIKDRGEIESAIAERAIMWLLVAFEPLDSGVLLPAVRFNGGRYNELLLEPDTDPGQQSISGAPDVDYMTEEIDEELLLELCANLLTLNSATGKWNFAHTSVSEYFEAHHFSVLHAHAYVGFTSLVVIIDFARFTLAYGLPEQSPVAGDGDNEREDESDGSDFWFDDRSEEGLADEEISSYQPIYLSLFQNSLVTYTFGYWGNHVSLVDKGVNTLKAVQDCTFERDAHTITEGLRILLRRFLGHPNNSSSEYRFWRHAFFDWLFNVWQTTRQGGMVFTIYYGQTTERYASFAAVHYGLFNLLSNWWQGSCDGHERGIFPTCEACICLNIDTTVTSEREDWSLLAIAAHFGHAHIVDALLSMGMDANSDNDTMWPKSSHPNTPLCIASKRGFMEVCRVLIKHCHPERLAGIEHALYVAADAHQNHIVRYLLSAGADPYHHIYGRSDNTVLTLAARQNNIELLRMFLEDNGDRPREHLPSQSELFNAAIKAAFFLRFDALMWLVFDGHVDPNARCSGQRYETILLAAAHDISSWSSSVFRRLKECGVDFNIQEADLCRLRQSQKSIYATLLVAVVHTGDVDLVQLAVEEWGEDVNAISNDSISGEYGSALIAGVKEGHLEVVQYLLKKNADANCQVPEAKFCNTPLTAALEGGHVAIADALIEHGADVNMPIKYGSHGSALICATALGDVANVQYLLDHGADINYLATTGKFASAIMTASIFGDREMASFLIERGAEASRPENHGWEKMLKESAERYKSWEEYDRYTIDRSQPFLSKPI